MTKVRTIIMSCVLVLIATFMMGTMYVFSNVTYSYTGSDVATKSDFVELKNLKVINGVDSSRVDGPHIIDDNVKVDIDLEPYETFTFKYDVVNKTGFDYELKKVLINCLNDESVNDYLSVSMTYENDKPINENDLLPDGTQRTIYVNIKYNKNAVDVQNFILYFDLMFNLK